ncbi:MAG: sulfatase-like hydrolase/transferase [Puniceicoccaceae bacterium]
MKTISVTRAIGLMVLLPLSGYCNHPNIVYILADDMGLGDLSCYNPEAKVRTPEIDRLASGGMRFTDAHTSASVCTPTRYGLLTGRYSWRSRLKDRVLGGYSMSLIEPGRDTVASLLKRHGYRTAMVGKWHLGISWKLKDGTWRESFGREIEAVEPLIDFAAPFKAGPCDFGFDYYFGINASLDFPPYTWLENDRAVTVPSEQRPFQGGKKAGQPQLMMRAGLQVPGFEPDQILLGLTRKAVEVIENADTHSPFFLYLPLTAPHTPVVPRQSFKGTSECGIYGDFIHEIDWTVGQVVAALKAKGILDNTLIVFTADNGASKASFPEEMEEEFRHNPSLHFRGRKASLWEGGHRVPFIVHWPDSVDAGSLSKSLCNLNDFYATCAALVGEPIQPEAAVDSFNMMPLLVGRPGEYVRNGMVHRDFRGWLAFRDGDWKLLMGRGPENQSLYNLAEDPSEKRNLLKENPTKVQELLEKLNRIILEGRSTPGPMQDNDGAQWWEQLYWMQPDAA